MNLLVIGIGHEKDLIIGYRIGSNFSYRASLIEIYIFRVFPSCELMKWAALWNSQSEQSSTLSRTVKQLIRAELNIIIHDPSK